MGAEKEKGGIFMLAIVFKAAYIIDIVLLIAMIIWAIVDAKRGFITCFFSFISTIVAIIVVAVFSKSIINWTNGLFGLEDLLAKGLGNWLGGMEIFTYDISQEGIFEYIETLSLPGFLKTAVNDEITAIYETNGWEIAAGTTLGQFVGAEIAGYLISIICAVVIFFLVKLIMLILRGIFNNIAESVPVFQKLNTIFGMIVGILKTLFFACLILAILSLIPSEGMTNFFNETLVVNVFYNHNPVMALLQSFFS